MNNGTTPLFFSCRLWMMANDLYCVELCNKFLDSNKCNSH